MAMNKQEFLDLCAVYALGALDGEDLARFRAAMTPPNQMDAEMKAALAEALALAENLSLAAPDAAPSPEVKSRLMGRIRHDARAAASPAVPARAVKTTARPRAAAPSGFSRLLGAWLTPRPALAAAFSLLVVTAGLLTWSLSLRGTVDVQRAGLGARDGRIAVLEDSLEGAEAMRARIVALEDSLAQKEAMLEVIRSREMQVVMLAGMKGNPGGYGKILWDPERKVAVLQVMLPPEPDSMDYQLWVIRDKKPMDAGVFQVGADPAGAGGMYRIEQLVETDRRHINAFAVTVEPKGGMPQPTGQMVLMGAIEL
jgi:anti-sigma-K factor RskA